MRTEALKSLFEGREEEEGKEEEEEDKDDEEDYILRFKPQTPNPCVNTGTCSVGIGPRWGVPKKIKNTALCGG